MKKKHFYQLIGVVGFLVIIAKVDLFKIAGVISHTDKRFVIYAGLLSLLVPILKAIRWNSLLRIQKVKCFFMNIFISYLMGTFLAIITPGRIGDLSRIYYVRRICLSKVSSGQLFANILIDRILDLLIVFIIAFIGNAIYFKEKLFLISIISTLALSSLIFVTISRNRYKVIHPISYLIERIDKIFPQLTLRAHFEEIIEGLRVLHVKGLFFPLLYNSISYVAFYAVIYFIARSLDLPLSMFYVFTCISTAMLLSILPITVAGVGIRDLIVIFYFSRMGIGNEVAISFSILYLFFCLIIPGFLGVVPYFIQPAYLKKELTEYQSHE